MDEAGHSPEARRSAGERVCVPFLRVCVHIETLREFFLDHVCGIMEVLEANLTKVHRENWSVWGAQ